MVSIETTPNPLQVLNRTTSSRNVNRGNASGRRNPYTQAVWLQDQIICRIEHDDVPPMAFASLARAWVELEDRKRILRGVPLPGQLRPDLDPMQLMKAVKRARSRKPIELAGGNGSGFAGPAEDLESVEPKQAKMKSATPNPEPPSESPTKESL